MLRARGARVVASDLSEAVHDLATDEVTTITGDIAEEETARRTVALALERFGSLDILVNNAGRTMNRPLVDMSVADWDGIMDVNARGNFLHSCEALRVMVERGGGAIVSVASIVSLVAMKETAAYVEGRHCPALLGRCGRVWRPWGARQRGRRGGNRDRHSKASWWTAGRRWPATAAPTRSAGSDRRSRSRR